MRIIIVRKYQNYIHETELEVVDEMFIGNLMEIYFQHHDEVIE